LKVWPPVFWRFDPQFSRFDPQFSCPPVFKCWSKCDPWGWRLRLESEDVFRFCCHRGYDYAFAWGEVSPALDLFQRRCFNFR
jgi:hypothetical protein